MTPPVALTIAGSDSGGGAGIQADLKTFAAYRCFGASVITAITAQNTQAVTDVHPIPLSTVEAQLAAVLDDLPVAAVKTGMLGSAEIAELVARRAGAGQLPHLVVDPVLISSTGYELGVVSAIERLLPYALVATPNVAEAAALLGRAVTTPDEMAAAARDLAAGGARYVVVTGGDLPGEGGGPVAVDAVWGPSGAELLRGPRVPTRNNHGSGCTFSAAIAAHLARLPGAEQPDPERVLGAIGNAKSYVARALAGSAWWRVGHGIGPLDQFEWSTPTTEADLTGGKDGDA